MECCAACREPLDPNDRPPVWPCCLARGHSACYGAASTCPACGAPAPVGGHGLTRLRVWPEGMARPERGGFMGPFAPSNLATACSTCNLMKVRAANPRPSPTPYPGPNPSVFPLTPTQGFRSVRGFVEESPLECYLWVVKRRQRQAGDHDRAARGVGKVDA